MNITAAPTRSSETRLTNGLEITDHYFEVPLDYAQQEGEKIEVFAREVSLKGASKKLPWLIFLQGGPGGESPRLGTSSGWCGELLKTHRLLLLDQRGTGLSSPVMPQTLATRGDATAQADYLTHFRTDSIVRDAEGIRKSLIGDSKWIGMGQSYGGFCLLTYLSFHPEGLSGVIITGGVACIKQHIKGNYRLTYNKVIDKNRLYFQRYPEDAAIVNEIVKCLQNQKVMLPSGVRLTDRRFQQLGMFFGGSGGLEAMHYLIEKAFINGVNGRELSEYFLARVEQSSAYENNPIFTIMHESIYAEGYATQWAGEALRKEFPEFDVNAEQFYFTGEMVSPTMLDDYKSLQPLKELAEILAQKSDWGKLYDLDQLAKNEVPVSAISYYDDMYVPVEWSEETAQHVGNFRIWVTNEWEHNGIGVDGPRIISRLLSQLAERAPYGFRG
ncbi:MAG: alpha/beta fold hydrolase [Akkermansiaceae bacterium]